MWLITNIGFFSVVEKPDDEATGTLTIRARVRADLEALRDNYLPGLGPISENTGSDYRFRAKVKRTDLSNAARQMILDINYVNFKDSVRKQQGKRRAEIYHQVWDVLYSLQQE